jgi:hypothetical protein
LRRAPGDAGARLAFNTLFSVGTGGGFADPSGSLPSP